MAMERQDRACVKGKMRKLAVHQLMVLFAIRNNQVKRR
jgi:hypothetical protein